LFGEVFHALDALVKAEAASGELDDFLPFTGIKERLEELTIPGDL